MIMHDISQENMPTDDDKGLANELIFKEKAKRPNLNQVLNDELPSESSASVMTPTEAKPQRK